ncbi:hypothetical protein Dimus_013229 [Dionaea muscipula]
MKQPIAHARLMTKRGLQSTVTAAAMHDTVGEVKQPFKVQTTAKYRLPSRSFLNDNPVSAARLKFIQSQLLPHEMMPRLN